MSEEEREIYMKTVQPQSKDERRSCESGGLESGDTTRKGTIKAKGNLNGKINTTFLVAHNLVVANQTPTQKRGTMEKKW